MKTKFTILILFCLFANFFHAQTTVLQSGTTLAALEDYYKKAGYTILDKGDGYLELKQGQKDSFFLDSSSYFLVFSTNPLLKENISQSKIDALLGRINDGPVVKAIHVPEKRKLLVEYYFPVSKGYTLETLLDVSSFFQSFAFGVYDKDQEKILE
ncbi:hypothetical protein EIB71_04350 [Kaistella daneshvariae]|jgi:hypothetical protein|uniref:YbjN domain-containing protein n=1 Tax=Kaistella daneshvariae TaxID=2487074 RepID=A0ABM7C7J3_9FLAO|nr:hypothetical protein [Kaistella daneshvariae]AZI66950.1 hypothetical protein EIB71_04350 [Kaistella daneshvariae]